MSRISFNSDSQAYERRVTFLLHVHRWLDQVPEASKGPSSVCLYSLWSWHNILVSPPSVIKMVGLMLFLFFLQRAGLKALQRTTYNTAHTQCCWDTLWNHRVCLLIFPSANWPHSQLHGRSSYPLLMLTSSHSASPHPVPTLSFKPPLQKDLLPPLWQSHSHFSYNSKLKTRSLPWLASTHHDLPKLRTFSALLRSEWDWFSYVESLKSISLFKNFHFR